MTVSPAPAATADAADADAATTAADAGVTVVVRSMDRPSLARALLSLARQTRRPAAVVVVNARGAAHRALPAAAQGLACRLVGAADGTPLPRARAANAGLDAAATPLVLFLDDDDELLPEHLARLSAALATHPAAVAAYADVELGAAGDDGTWRAAHTFAADFDPVRLLFENYLPIHAVLFRAVPPDGQPPPRFDESFDLYEDWDFWLALAARGPFVRVAGVSARYQRDAGEDSGVFDDTDPARRARAWLFAKWQSRIPPTLHAGLLAQAQRSHRDAARAEAERALLAQGHAAQRAVLAARDGELGDAARHIAGLEQALAAHVSGLAEATREAESRAALAVAREHERDAALHETAALRAVLAAREREIADAASEGDALRAVLAAREREIGDGLAHAAGLSEVLAHRDAEIGALRAALQGHAAELERLRDEPPLQALARALKRSPRP